MYNTGFHWLASTDLSSVSATVYGSGASWLTSARLEADLAANQVAVLDVEGAKNIAICPFASSVTADSGGSGTTSALIRIYGAIGFGETTQSTWDSNPILVSALVDVTIGSTSSGAVTAITNQLYDTGGATQLALTNPATGSTYTEYVASGTGVAQKGQLWTQAVTYAVSSNTAVVTDYDIPAASGVAGITTIGDIQMFQKLLFTMNMGSLDACSANALVARLY
jgi:hypothetical protein